MPKDSWAYYAKEEKCRWFRTARHYFYCCEHLLGVIDEKNEVINKLSKLNPATEKDT